MSFLKIKDPLKREEMVKEYLATKKRIRDSQLAERTGEIELQTDLSKFFRPITETQKVTTKEITEGLKPIKEGVSQLPGAITEGLTPIREGIIQIPVQLSKIVQKSSPPSYQKTTIEEDEEEIRNFVKVFNIKLAKYKYDFDNVYRIVFDSDLEKIKFGKHVISYNPNNKTFSLEKTIFPATDGLWELILSNNPKKFTQKDFNAYQNLIYLSDIMFKDNNRKNELKTYNILGEKWKNIIAPVFNYIKKSTGEGLRKKKTTMVIPSDPNALLERLDLLMASKEAGNTGVRNELVSICDELKRQHVLNTKSYKKINVFTIK